MSLFIEHVSSVLLLLNLKSLLQ